MRAMSITSFRCLYYSLSTDFKDITAFFLLLTLNKEMLLSFVNNNAVKIKWLNILCLWKGSRRILSWRISPANSPRPNSPLVSSPNLIHPWWISNGLDLELTGRNSPGRNLIGGNWPGGHFAGGNSSHPLWKEYDRNV